MRCIWAQVHWLLLGNLEVPNRKDGKAAKEKYDKYYRKTHGDALQFTRSLADTPTIKWAKYA